MLNTPGTLCGRLRVEALSIKSSPAVLIRRLEQLDDPALLESSALDAEYGRYTLLGCEPLAVLTAHAGRLTDATGRLLAEGQDLWAKLDELLAKVRVQNPTSPYAPGWIGYFGYEMGRAIESLPGRAPRTTALPDMRLAFYDSLLVYDGVMRTWSLVHIEFDSPPVGSGASAVSLRRFAQRADSDYPDSAAADSPPVPVEQSDASVGPLAQAEGDFDRAAYQQAVQQCIDYIAAGDVFQVNLSQRFTVADAPAPLDIYRVLRRRNPAWYAAYIPFKARGRQCAIVSSSPELFLRVRGRQIITRPIKGTRPRGGNPEIDTRTRGDLWQSPKDNAELAMIIDLMRNDLGRICRYGSIRVIEPRRLETHPTVYHLVGTVSGELRPEVGHGSMLRATFPGGSVTGAPKIRAMEIIDELEPCARGVYCGCVGMVGVDGSAEWNIAIRTIVCDNGTAHVQVGGGIVADSDPLDEHQETLHKARAMLEAIETARTGPRDSKA